MAIEKKTTTEKKVTAPKKTATQRTTRAEVNPQMDVYSNVEQFFLNNRNIIIGIIAALAIGIGGYYGYKKLILEPKEQEAQNKIVLPQANFQKDSLQLALNGDGINPGFLQIVNDYSNTTQGNLAHYYAGVCYLKMKDYDNAITQLEKFDAPTDELAGMSNMQLGHAYSEKNEMDKAVDHYKKAGEVAKSEFFSPYFYKMAGDLLIEQGKYKEAKDVYEIIKRDYPLSGEGQNIDLDIAYTETKLGE